MSGRREVAQANGIETAATGLGSRGDSMWDSGLRRRSTAAERLTVKRHIYEDANGSNSARRRTRCGCGSVCWSGLLPCSNRASSGIRVSYCAVATERRRKSAWHRGQQPEANDGGAVRRDLTHSCWLAGPAPNVPASRHRRGKVRTHIHRPFLSAEGLYAGRRRKQARKTPPTNPRKSAAGLTTWQPTTDN